MILTANEAYALAEELALRGAGSFTFETVEGVQTFTICEPEEKQKRWMRNYGAMKDEKLLRIAEDLFNWHLTGQFSDTTDRVLSKGGDLQEHYIAANKECDKRGLDRS